MFLFPAALMDDPTATPWPTAVSGTPSFIAILFSCIAGIALIALSISYLCCTKQSIDECGQDDQFYMSAAGDENPLVISNQI